MEELSKLFAREDHFKSRSVSRGGTHIANEFYHYSS